MCPDIGLRKLSGFLFLSLQSQFTKYHKVSDLALNKTVCSLHFSFAVRQDPHQPNVRASQVGASVGAAGLHRGGDDHVRRTIGKS